MAFFATRTNLLQDFEYRGYDAMVNTGAYASQDARVVVVDFDDAALQQFATYPIPRAKIAETVAAVAAGSPEMIGLDLLLSEARTPAEDAAMADALRGAGNVVIAALHDSNQVPLAEPLPAFCTPDPSVASACTANSAAFAVGMVNMPVDSDGFIRRFYLLPPKNYSALPFPVALATNFAGKPLTRGAGRDVQFGDATLHPDRSGNNTALIGTWSRQPGTTVPAVEVLRAGFDPRVFNGKIVLIGQSNAAAGDRHFTPLFRSTAAGGKRLMLPGTQLMAAALTSMLDEKTVRVLAPGTVWGITFCIVATALAMLLRMRPAAGALSFLAAGAATYGTAQLLFSAGHIWLPFIGTEAALALALPAGLGYRFVRERLLKSASEAERKQLMGIFARYVSPEVAAEIWKRRSEIVLSGQEKMVTVMFTDIRSFTKKTAGKPSAEVLRWLNEYFSAMTEVTQHYGGYINKFIGDGMMILFGVPLTQGSRQDACSAVRAGLAMIERLKRFNDEHAKEPGFPPDLHIGVGIHTGLAVAGNVGAHDRLEYSAIGETVNLASRLESATKDFHVDLVMSPPTWELVKDAFETRPLGETQIRGFSEQITLYGASVSAAAAAPQMELA